MRECCIEAQQPSRSGLAGVWLERWRWPTWPRTGEMGGRFLIVKEIQSWHHSISSIAIITRAFLALLHHHRPELVDLSKMEEEDTVTNCSKAFSIAEVSCLDHCGIEHSDQMHLHL